MSDRAGGLVQRAPVQRHETPGGAACRRERHLLPDHGPHGELEAVGGPRHAQAGPPPHKRREQRIAPERLVDADGVGVQVEQSPAAGQRVRAVALVVEAQREPRIAAGNAALLARRSAGHAHLRHGRSAGELQRAPVAGPVNRLDAGNGTHGEESQNLDHPDVTTPPSPAL
jgi:hypothetical protein